MTLRGAYAFEDSVFEAEIVQGTGAGTATGAFALRGAHTRGFQLASSTTLTTIAPPGLSASTVFWGLAYRTDLFVAVRCLTLQEGSTIHCGVGFDASGHITIYGAAGTVLATSTAVFPTSAWTYIDIKAVISDTVGSVEVWVDGTSVVSTTGADTKNGGTGVVNTVGGRAPTGGANCAWTDIYVLDTAGSAPLNDRLGDVAVRIQTADGNGDSSDFVGSDGNSVNNYQQVDETPVSTSTDYNGTALTGKTDLYTYADVPTTDVPLAYQTYLYAGKSDAGTPPIIKPVTKGDGGTVREEAAITLSTTYQIFCGAWNTTDPDSDALTATNVNAMQVGARTS